MIWSSATQELRSDILTEVVQHMKDVEKCRADGRPNYIWLSRRGSNVRLSKQQNEQLQQLLSKMGFESCRIAIQRLRTTLCENKDYQSKDVPEIMIRILLQVACEAQRADMLSSAIIDNRRRGSLFGSRSSSRRVAPQMSSRDSATPIITIAESVTTRDSPRSKTVSFSNKSANSRPRERASTNNLLILKPILKTISSETINELI